MRPTSIAAYNAIKANGLLRGLQWKVYNTLSGYDAMTASEAAQWIPGHRINSINPRFAELQRKGVIRAVGERRCSVTGRQTVAWEITDQLPTVEERHTPGRTNALRRDLEAAITRLETLERDCKTLQVENAAMKAKLKKWGRPKDVARREKKIIIGANVQDLPCIIPSNSVNKECERERTHSAGEANRPRQAGDGGACGGVDVDHERPNGSDHAFENGGSAGAAAGHGGGVL
jgi:hypothetical protein